MEAYLARQPIFNLKKQVEGYELLYRDGGTNEANVPDGLYATGRLLSNALTTFGLSGLTNNHRAFINFPKQLIMDDFVRIANPGDVVIELLEDIEVDDAFVEKITELKKDGYTMALDDYTGQPQFEPLLSLVNILKVDFLLTDLTQQREIAKKMRGTDVTLLAEKVETAEVFDFAAKMGYTLFQGYFFEKPHMMKQSVPSVATSSYVHIIKELQKSEIDFDRCTRTIESDVVLTFRMMRLAQSMRYYRGNRVTTIQQGLMLMGSKNLRRWIVLMLARDNNVTHSDELVRTSYLRGIFTERLMLQSSCIENGHDGFLLGMFSLLDIIMGMPMKTLLGEVQLPEEIVQVLIGREDTLYARFLHYVVDYESGNPPSNVCGLDINEKTVSSLYMECVMETDKTFSEIGEIENSCKKAVKK